MPITTSPAYRPFSAVTVAQNRVGAFTPTITSSQGTGIYAVDPSMGGAWVASGTATTGTAGDKSLVLAWRSNIATLNCSSMGIKGTLGSNFFSGFPASFTDGSNMFATNQLTGTIPTLPTGLTNGSNMFRQNQLTGAVPALPASLTTAAGMFQLNQLSGTIPTLPTGLTNGSAMFYQNQLTGTIPTLPTSLTNGSNMFATNQLTGTIPTLPTGLTNGSYMFYQNQLTGTIPTLPTSLTNGSYMFASNTGLTYPTAPGGPFATTRCVAWANALDGCAFTQAMVNAILQDFQTAHNNALINGANLRLGLSGGTNGAPSGAGLTARNALVALGAIITTN